MNDQMKYYKKELDDMGKFVNECNIAILDSVEYFMDEADANMSGISRDVVRPSYRTSRLKPTAAFTVPANRWQASPTYRLKPIASRQC